MASFANVKPAKVQNFQQFGASMESKPVTAAINAISSIVSGAMDGLERATDIVNREFGIEFNAHDHVAYHTRLRAEWAMAAVVAPVRAKKADLAMPSVLGGVRKQSAALTTPSSYTANSRPARPGDDETERVQLSQRAVGGASSYSTRDDERQQPRGQALASRVSAPLSQRGYTDEASRPSLQGYTDEASRPSSQSRGSANIGVPPTRSHAREETGRGPEQGHEDSRGVQSRDQTGRPRLSDQSRDEVPPTRSYAREESGRGPEQSHEDSRGVQSRDQAVRPRLSDQSRDEVVRVQTRPRPSDQIRGSDREGPRGHVDGSSIRPMDSHRRPDSVTDEDDTRGQALEDARSRVVTHDDSYDADSKDINPSDHGEE